MDFVILSGTTTRIKQVPSSGYEMQAFGGFLCQTSTLLYRLHYFMALHSYGEFRRCFLMPHSFLFLLLRKMKEAT
jgi:hypothetical protein